MPDKNQEAKPPKTPNRTSAQVAGDAFMRLGLPEIREMITYVGSAEDGYDMLALLDSRLRDYFDEYLREQREALNETEEATREVQANR